MTVVDERRDPKGRSPPFALRVRRSLCALPTSMRPMETHYKRNDGQEIFDLLAADPRVMQAETNPPTRHAG